MTVIQNPKYGTPFIAKTYPANPDNVRKWVEWSEKPIDEKLLGEVLDILKPIHNWFYIEGRPENNDPRQ